MAKFVDSTPYYITKIHILSIIYQLSDINNLGRIPLEPMHRSRCLYTCYRQNINGCELLLEGAHYHLILMTQHCGFMLSNVMYSRILIF